MKGEKEALPDINKGKIQSMVGLGAFVWCFSQIFFYFFLFNELELDLVSMHNYIIFTFLLSCLSSKTLTETGYEKYNEVTH